MSSTERADPTSQRARAEELFAVLAWLVCAVVLVVYVARYAAPLPFSDDVLMAPYVDPHEPLSGNLLWLQHNEHRIPLVKLLYVALVGGAHDLRAGSWFQAVALLGLSAGVLWGLRRRTGRLVASDAAIPLILLTTSNAENLLNSFQIAFTLPVVLAGSLLVLALMRPEPPRVWGIAAIGLVLLALVACGSVGIVQATVFALWMAVVAVRAWRARAPGWKRTATATVLVLAALLAYLQAYFHGFEHLPGHAAPGLARYLSVAVQFFTCSVGAVAMPIWPWSGVLVIAALAGGSFVLVRSLRGTDSALALALLAQLLAGLALALAIAYGRAADGPNAGFTNRYVVLAALPLCTAYLAVRLLGRGLPARLGELTLAAVVLAGFVGNYEYAFMVGHGRDLIVRRFHKHAAEGAGIAELANTSWPSYYYGETEFRDLLGQWRRAGFVDGVLPGERVDDGADPLALLPATSVPVESDTPLAARLVDGRYVVLTRGRARFEFAVPPGSRRFRARVELDPCGRDPRLHVFVVGRKGSGAERVLFEHELAPRTERASRSTSSSPRRSSRPSSSASSHPEGPARRASDCSPASRSVPIGEARAGGLTKEAGLKRNPLSMELHRAIPVPFELTRVPNLELTSARAGDKDVPTGKPVLALEETPRGWVLHVLAPIAATIGSPWYRTITTQGISITLEEPLR